MDYTVSIVPFRLGVDPLSWAMKEVSSEAIVTLASTRTWVSVDVDGSGSGTTLGVWGRGKIVIFGLISKTELGAFFISSKGISSDRGLGILGLPSRDLARLPEESRDLWLLPLLFGRSSFLWLGRRLGLSRSLFRISGSARCITPKERSCNKNTNKSVKITDWVCNNQHCIKMNYQENNYINLKKWIT